MKAILLSLSLLAIHAADIPPEFLTRKAELETMLQKERGSLTIAEKELNLMRSKDGRSKERETQQMQYSVESARQHLAAVEIELRDVKGKIAAFGQSAPSAQPQVPAFGNRRSVQISSVFVPAKGSTNKPVTNAVVFLPK